LLERVVHLRRHEAAEADAQTDAQADTQADEPAEATDAERIRALEDRVRYLETLVEGLQDSVHRESVRREKQINALESKTEPGAITRALSREARERGI
jgi:hypothetical protein